MLNPVPDNPWLAEVHAGLPRLLALFDRDPLAPTLGQGDRLYWAWKLKDFGNGTFQGAAHGLARLLVANLLPNWLSPAAVQARIERMFDGARALTRANGSLEEAFPYESSFCVTALVAWDLLSAIHLLRERVSADQVRAWTAVVAPMIRFLRRADETHATISNHLATAVAALVAWHDLTGDGGDDRARMLLQRIRDHASPEGWFREYDGADPGYQTLALCYLAEVDLRRPDWALYPELAAASAFLTYFVHPDGSFGGHYGSRETRVFYPAGVECLALRDRQAAAMAVAMRAAVAIHATVPLAAIDESNLVPLFNAYCRAAELVNAAKTVEPSAALPCAMPGPWRKAFDAAGLLVDRQSDSYTIVSWRKGGAYAHFEAGSPARLGSAPACEDGAGRRHSAQGADPDATCVIDDTGIEVRAPLRRFRHELPTPWRFIVLRLMNVSVMRWSVIGEWVKRLLVRLLISRRGSVLGTARRRIRFAPVFAVEDDLVGVPTQSRLIPGYPLHSPLHMASRGYWQRGDDRN